MLVLTNGNNPDSAVKVNTIDSAATALANLNVNTSSTSSQINVPAAVEFRENLNTPANIIMPSHVNRGLYTAPHTPAESAGVCQTPPDSGRLKFQCDMGQICQTESWWSLPESARVCQSLPDSAESGRLQQD